MDFQFSPEEERLLKDVRHFIKSESTPELLEETHRLGHIYGGKEGRKFIKKFAANGWLTPNWPEEYGGLNASATTKMLFEETAAYYQAPGVDLIGVKMIGPLIYLLGTDEQKAEHLSPIARGERFWCQGWSEPDAGSDLAALTTTGIRDGDHYVVNGQKVWTSGAHRSDWVFLLVRSDPESKRSRGLTFLLADMKTPGITVREIPWMNGQTHFCEVFLDNVRIPVKNRI